MEQLNTKSHIWALLYYCIVVAFSHLPPLERIHTNTVKHRQNEWNRIFQTEYNAQLRKIHHKSPFATISFTFINYFQCCYYKPCIQMILMMRNC